MASEFQFPDAPEVGGDSYEIDRWFQQVEEYLNKFTGQEREDIELDLLYRIRRAFWEANPETEPTERQRQKEEAAQRDHDRRIRRRVEIVEMRDPAWIFGKDDD